MHPWQLRCATRVILGGGVLAYPTETVWGLGCNPADARAVQRIWALKGRDAAKGLILIAPRVGLLTPWMGELNDTRRERLAKRTDRPTTWIVPVNPDTPPWLTGGRPTLAVRVTDQPVVRALCEATALPLVSTSANPAGRPPARSGLMVRHYFDQRLDYIAAGSGRGTGRPSEIRELDSGRILRRG
jgi:L-threonylcarbamoyladenylate synthase